MVTLQKMNEMSPEDRDQHIREEIMTLTGMSHLMIHTFILTKDTKHVDNLEYVIWPNRNVKSLGKNVLELEKVLKAFKENKEKNSQKVRKNASRNDDTKPKASKQHSKPFNHDEIRKFLISEAEKEITKLSEAEIDERIVKMMSSSTPIKSLSYNRSIIGGDEDDDLVDTNEEYPWSYSENNTSIMMDDSLLHNNNQSNATILSNYKRDALLMYDYVGWGVTKTGCYVFVYYIGPENRSDDNYELKQSENWKVVPKSHLSHFHKHITPYTHYKLYLNHTRFSLKQNKFILKHIEYDARYIVLKWQKNSSVSKEHFARILDNKELFASLPDRREYHIKVIEQRMKEQELNSIEAMTLCDVNTTTTTTTGVSSKSPLSSPLLNSTSPTTTTSLSMTSPDKRKYSSLTIDNYPRMAQRPLGSSRFGFEKFKHLVTHVVENRLIPPKEYLWEPKDMVEAILIAFNTDLHARAQISSLFEDYNVSLDNFDTSHLAETMFYNEDAQYDIKQSTREYVFANVLVDLLTRDPDTPFPRSSNTGSFVLPFNK